MEEMQCKYERELRILPSMCDGESKLKMAGALDIFQDTATIHAEQLGIGPEDMNEKNYFWVITKTRMHIYRMPELMDTVTSATWVQPPTAARSERDYSVTKDGELLVYGKSEWAAIGLDNGRPAHMSKLFPGVEYTEPSPDDRAFLKLKRDLSGAETIGEYTVRSVDIDLGGHMNNVNYFRAMMGQFSCEEINEMGIEEAELHFISQTFEGETITFKRLEAEYGCDIAAVNEDGKTVFAAALHFKG